jgi:hypothetical protein
MSVSDRRRITKTLEMAIVGFCMAYPALAAPPSVTFDLTGVNGASLAGVYTSPYYGNVTGGATLPVVCDDFSDDSYLPEEFTAYITSLSNVPTSGDTYLKWSGAYSGPDSNHAGQGFTVDGNNYPGWNLNQQQAYTVAAYLQTEILASASGSTQQEDLSFALWELFDAQGDWAENWGGTDSSSVVEWLGNSYQTDLEAASKDVEDAITALNDGTAAKTLSGYNVTIYSYDAPPDGMTPLCGQDLNRPCDTLPPQEFITVTQVPEAGVSSLCDFAAYLLLGGVAFLSCRKPSGSQQ